MCVVVYGVQMIIYEVEDVVCVVGYMIVMVMVLVDDCFVCQVFGLFEGKVVEVIVVVVVEQNMFELFVFFDFCVFYVMFDLQYCEYGYSVVIDQFVGVQFVMCYLIELGYCEIVYFGGFLGWVEVEV